MLKLKSLIALLAIFLFFVSLYYFIKFNNDHLECETIISSEIDKSGNKISKKEHICNEEYSF